MTLGRKVAVGLYATSTRELAPIFRSRLPREWTLTEVQPPTIADHIRHFDYLVAGGAPLNGQMIGRATNLKALHKMGVGYDDVDVAALQRKRIRLAVCDAGSADAVAEHALALAFAAVKNLTNLDYAVRHRSAWPKWEARQSLSRMGGRTVGIVGFGRIGQTVARHFASLGCEVLVFTRSQHPSVPPVSFLSSITELFARSSLVSVHVPSTPATAGLIDRPLLEALGPKGVLVNTSRGSVVVQDELFDALRNGKLGFAALDVLDREPPDASLDLRHFHNLIVTPHIGGGGLDTFEVKADFIFDNLETFHRGGPLSGVVNLWPGLDQARQDQK